MGTHITFSHMSYGIYLYMFIKYIVFIYKYLYLYFI